MNLDDLRKQRPSLAMRDPKPPRGSNTISMDDLRARFGLPPQPKSPGVVNAPKISDEDAPPPPAKK